MIETIEHPELIAIGFLVEAHWNELPRVIPKTWRRLFALDTGATSFLEVSVSREKGIYRELVGFLAAKKTIVPVGMVRLTIPANRYLRIIHDGPLVGIAQGFESLYAHASAQGLSATDLKLDFGYAPGLPPGRHELHIALAPLEPPRLG